MPTKKAANAKMAICCLTKTYPRPHVESNHDLAFRKRPFYPLNYRGEVIKQIFKKVRHIF